MRHHHGSTLAHVRATRPRSPVPRRARRSGSAGRSGMVLVGMRASSLALLRRLSGSACLTPWATQGLRRPIRRRPPGPPRPHPRPRHPLRRPLIPPRASPRTGHAPDPAVRTGPDAVRDTGPPPGVDEATLLYAGGFLAQGVLRGGRVTAARSKWQGSRDKRLRCTRPQYHRLISVTKHTVSAFVLTQTQPSNSDLGCPAAGTSLGSTQRKSRLRIPGSVSQTIPSDGSLTVRGAIRGRQGAGGSAGDG